jgi:hypothetical protein
LELGPGHRLDMGRIMGSPFKVRQVLIAACVGGKVREDLDGEPSGIVGGYLYRGTSQVAASVVALPDNWMMLTSLLIHQAWLKYGDLDQAVAEAKQRLQRGDWDHTIETLFAACASEALAKARLRQQLADILAWRRQEQWSSLLAPLCKADPASPYRDLSELLDRVDETTDRDARIAALADEVAEALCPYHAAGTGADRGTATADLHPAISEVITRRIPPEPLLGTLLYGIRTFGELS